MVSRHVRAYRALLRLYPRRFRGEYRDEMTRLFADQLRDVRLTEGAVGVLRLWARSLVDLVATAPGQHLEKEVLVASPVGASDPSSSVRRRPSSVPWVIAGLAPLWFVIGSRVLAPGFLDPLFLNPPGVLGLPLGVVLQGIALAWMSLGVLIVLST